MNSMQTAQCYRCKYLHSLKVSASGRRLSGLAFLVQMFFICPLQLVTSAIRRNSVISENEVLQLYWSQVLVTCWSYWTVIFHSPWTFERSLYRSVQTYEWSRRPMCWNAWRTFTNPKRLIWSYSGNRQYTAASRLEPLWFYHLQKPGK
jgi:hypothetical protein